MSSAAGFAGPSQEPHAPADEAEEAEMEAPAVAREVEAEGEAEREPATLEESARLEREARRAAVNSDGDLFSCWRPASAC